MTKLLPFDLEAAKAGAKVVTRDGRPVRIVCWDMKGKWPLVVIAPNYDETEGLFAIGIDGCFNNRETNLDLFLAPTPVKRWRVIYRGADDNAAQMDFEQYKDASKFWCENDFSAKPFEVEVTP